MYRFMLILGIVLVPSLLYAQEPKDVGALGPIEHWPRILEDHNQLVRELIDTVKMNKSTILGDRDGIEHNAILLLGELRAAEAAEPLLEIIGLEFGSFLAPDPKPRAYPAQEALFGIGKPASTKAVEFLAKNANDELAKLFVKLIIRIEGRALGKEMVRLAAEKEMDDEKRGRLRKALTLFKDIDDEDVERREPDAKESDWREKNREKHDRRIRELLAVVKSARALTLKKNEERPLDGSEHQAIVLLGELRAAQAADLLLEIMDRRFFGDVKHPDGRPLLASVFAYPVPDALVKIGKPASRKAVELLAKEENADRVKLMVKLIAKIEGFELGKEMVRLAVEKERGDMRKTRLRKALDQFKVLDRNIGWLDKCLEISDARKKSVAEQKQRVRNLIDTVKQGSEAEPFCLYKGVCKEGLLDGVEHRAIVLLGELRSTESVETLLEIIERKFVAMEGLDPVKPIYPAEEALVKIGKPASRRALELLAGGTLPNLAEVHVRLISRIEGTELGKEMVKLAAKQTTDDKQKKRLTEALKLFK